MDEQSRSYSWHQEGCRTPLISADWMFLGGGVYRGGSAASYNAVEVLGCDFDRPAVPRRSLPVPRALVPRHRVEPVCSSVLCEHHAV